MPSVSRIVLPLILLPLFIAPAKAQQTTLRVHQMLPPQAAVPSKFIAEWAKKVEADAKGTLRIELYPSMQLGGTPPQLFDQARDGTVDVSWTLTGYSPGRFSKTEVFELPFIGGNAEQNSQALWEFYEKHLRDEYKDVKVLAVHTHGPGLIHAKGNGVRKLEDLRGMKLRGPSRIVNKYIAELGATPIGMPVPQMPDALSKGVIDATVVPWEVTAPLRVAELVNTHTTFAGNRSLYVATFVFAMNKDKFDKLTPEQQKAIDQNSGMVASRWIGRVMDEGDAPGLAAAKARNNTILALDAAETKRWKDAGKKIIDEWIKEMNAKGHNGSLLVEEARALIAKYAGPEQ